MNPDRRLHMLRIDPITKTPILMSFSEDEYLENLGIDIWNTTSEEIKKACGWDVLMVDEFFEE